MDDLFSKYTERYTVESFNKIGIEPDTKEEHSEENIIFSNSDKYSDKIYESSYQIIRDVGYMCPNCYNVQHIRTHVDNNAKIEFDRITDNEVDEIEALNGNLSVEYKYHSKCPLCRYYVNHVILDDAIANTIGILNIKGYYTDASCEGHINEKKSPYIRFNNFGHFNRQMIERYLENTLPISWYVYKPYYTYTYRDINTKALVPVTRTIPITAIKSFTIASDYFNKEEALRDILKWARSLKDLTKEG